MTIDSVLIIEGGVLTREVPLYIIILIVSLTMQKEGQVVNLQCGYRTLDATGVNLTLYCSIYMS